MILWIFLQNDLTLLEQNPAREFRVSAYLWIIYVRKGFVNWFLVKKNTDLSGINDTLDISAESLHFNMSKTYMGIKCILVDRLCQTRFCGFITCNIFIQEWMISNIGYNEIKPAMEFWVYSYLRVDNSDQFLFCMCPGLMINNIQTPTEIKPINFGISGQFLSENAGLQYINFGNFRSSHIQV